MLKFILTSIVSCISFWSFSQTEIGWATLADVKFTDKFSREVDAYYYYPHFGASVKSLEGKEISIKGFMLVIDPENSIYVLSKNPFAECFFCGNAGPESIIELKLKDGHPKFKMDQIVTVKGRLKLNADDIYQCNYILEEAEVSKE